MISTIPPSAFDVLYQQLEACLADVQEQIAQAARQATFDRVDELSKRGRELTELRMDLHVIENRFGRLVEAETEEPTDAKRIRKGLKTPQEAYRVPILQALVELGGRCELHPVLDRVYEMMKVSIVGRHCTSDVHPKCTRARARLAAIL